MTQSFAEVAPCRVDAWLNNIVAGLVGPAESIEVDTDELWALLDTLPVAILVGTDRQCSRMVGNRAAQLMFRAELGSNLSQSAPAPEAPEFHVYAKGKRVHEADLPMQRAARTGRRVNRSVCEIRFKDESRIFIAGQCIPLKNRAGEICGSLGAFVDITEQRTTEEHSLLLASEMTHRVKNTVSLIQALAHATIRSHLEPSTYAIFDQRLVNLAHAQDLISRSTAAPRLRDLLVTSIGSVALGKMSSVELSGPPVGISADRAASLSMVFHELTTNACKYGALKADGTVSVSWAVEDGLVIVTWREDGHSDPALWKPGFGSELIDRVCQSLPRGKFRRSSAGSQLSATLQFAT